MPQQCAPAIPPVLLQQRDMLTKRMPATTDVDAYAMWQSAMQDIEARIAAVSQETLPASAEGGSIMGASATVRAGAGARAFALALAAQGAQGTAAGTVWGAR